MLVEDVWWTAVVLDRSKTSPMREMRCVEFDFVHILCDIEMHTRYSTVVYYTVPFNCDEAVTGMVPWRRKQSTEQRNPDP